MANPSLQIGSGNWAIKADELLGYRVVGNKYFPVPIDVSRATAATRVDEAGLVNYAEVLGGEDVVNGDFATDTVWNRTGTWSIESNYATANGNSTSQYIQQDFTITNGKTYLFTYEIIENTLNGNGASLSGSGGFVSVSLSSAIGTHQVYITADDDAAAYALKIGVSGTATTGTIKLDNVSVKEVTRDNVPRIDYTGGGCPHILAEPQRTNLVTYSSDFSQWSLSNSTLTSDYSDSIFGGKKSYLMTSTASPSAIYTAISSTNNTQTFFVKKGNHNYIQILNFGSSQFYGNFDIDSGIVGSKGTLTDSSTIEDLGNGWYKISCYFVGSITSTRLYFSESLTAAYGGGTTSSGLTVELAGCQSEVGSYATSYIPTNGEAGGVTRNQDIFTRDGIGSLINSTEGVLFAEIAALSDDSTDKRITLGDGTSSNRIIIGYNAQDKIQIFFAGTSGSFTPDYVIDITQYAKIAVSWSSTKAKFYVNGSPVLETLGDFSFAADTLTELLFDNGTGSFSFFGKVKQLQVYDTALTDTQLAALTS